MQKQAAPYSAKNFLVLSRTLQTYSAITQNEQPIDDIFYGEEI